MSFQFDGTVEGLPYPSLSAPQQETFKADFFRELAGIRQWAARQQWPYPGGLELQVFVSDEYKIARSLVPAAIGKRGRMEFPAWKAVAGEAPIVHELAHVLFPNGNRLLAEGLAIHLQATIGGNAAFPNFGRPLDQLAHELLIEMVPGFAPGKPEALNLIQFGDLDRTATPSPLRLRIGRVLYENTPSGQAHLYAIAGSFIAFVIKAHGLEKFRELYAQTPLLPFARDAGSPTRWDEVYGRSLEALEAEWRVVVASC